MRNKMIVFFVILQVSLMCVGCSSEIEMPYSSEEYANGDWTIEELEEHFEELGFADIEICGDTTKIIGVYAENEDSLYDSFEKGDAIEESRRIGIYTEFESSEPLSIDNCPEFAEIVESGIDSSENKEAWEAFLEANVGEFLMFNGTITDWYDGAFWVGVSFTVAIEDSESLSYYQDTISLLDLGMTGEYHYENYSSGLIEEGMKVFVVTEIKQSEEGCYLKYDSMQIIE